MVKINELFDQDSKSNPGTNNNLLYNLTDDLIVFMRNDPMFYRKHLYPKLLDIQKLLKSKNKINKKSLLPLVDTALMTYIKKFNIDIKPANLLSKEEKLQCINKILTDEVNNFKNEDY